MRWLCLEYCPSTSPIRAIQEAATLGKVHILEWFLTIQVDASSNKRVADTSVKSGNVSLLKLVFPHIESPELAAELMGRASSHMYSDFAIIKCLHERVTHLGIDPPSSPFLQDVLSIATGSEDIAEFLRSHDYFAPLTHLWVQFQSEKQQASTASRNTATEQTHACRSIKLLYDHALGCVRKRTHLGSPSRTCILSASV